MNKLTYITDLERRPSDGGSYVVNWHAQEQLARHFDLRTPAPIVPRASRAGMLLSRVQRYVLRRPSAFVYFSPSTLDDNARQVAASCDPEADGVVFRSAARWCHATPPVPYFVYLDAVFKTFFENTFDEEDFQAADLERIWEAEALFLERASAVFFESRWGMEEARRAYSLSGAHYVAAGRGGGVEPPEEDRYRDDAERVLLFVAGDFEKKGGDLLVEAFRQLAEIYPELRLHVVGGAPNGTWGRIEGVIHEGFLRLDHRQDLERYRALLAEAFLLVHPTREDTSPLVVTEAAYFGCPTVSVRRFALPELVVDGETGVLVDWPARPDELARVVRRLIEAPEEYRRMRRAAFEHSRQHFLWDRVGGEMARTIGDALS